METDHKVLLEQLLEDTSTLYRNLQAAVRDLDSCRRANEQAKTTVRELERQLDTAVQEELMLQAALAKAKDPNAVMTASDAAMRKQQFDAHIERMSRGNGMHAALAAEVQRAKQKEVMTGLDASAARDHHGALLALVSLRQHELASLAQLVASKAATDQNDAVVSQLHLMASLYEQANSKREGEQHVSKSTGSTWTDGLRAVLGRNRGA